MTQPIYDPQLWVEFLALYEERHGEFPVPVLIGVLPLQSHKHASFLHNEVPGITLSDEALERMRKAGADGRQEGVKMAQELLLELKELPHVQGVYLMPSFGRYELACQVLEVLTPEEQRRLQPDRVAVRPNATAAVSRSSAGGDCQRDGRLTRMRKADGPFFGANVVRTLFRCAVKQAVLVRQTPDRARFRYPSIRCRSARCRCRALWRPPLWRRSAPPAN